MPLARLCRSLFVAAALACTTVAHAQCPSAPALTAAPTGCGVQLSWSLALFATSYNVYRSTTSASNGTLVTNTTALSYTDTPALLPAGQSYFYHVVGESQVCPSANHEGAYSNVASAAPTHMAAPTIAALNPGCGTITFSWNPVPGATSYRVSRMLYSSELDFASIPPSQTSYSYTLGNDTPPTDFGITAVGACESSARTLVGGTAGTPAAVLFGFAATGTCSGIRLSWAFSPGNADSIRIIRTAPGLPDTTTVVGLDIYSVFDSTAAPGVTYTYFAAPSNPICGPTAASAAAAAIVPFSAPNLLPPLRKLPGQTAFLNSSASPGGTSTVTYQWRRNGVDVSNGGRISGATSATLTITAARPEDSDVYSVTATGCSTTATSTIALVVPNTCPADFNLSGGLEVQDIFDFLNGWFASCP